MRSATTYAIVQVKNLVKQNSGNFNKISLVRSEIIFHQIFSQSNQTFFPYIFLFILIFFFLRRKQSNLAGLIVLDLVSENYAFRTPDSYLSSLCLGTLEPPRRFNLRINQTARKSRFFFDAPVILPRPARQMMAVNYGELSLSPSLAGSAKGDSCNERESLANFIVH